MSTSTITAVNPVQAEQAIRKQLWPYIKAMLIAQHQLTITAKPVTRSAGQNAKLHAMLSEIATQRDWAGQRRDVDTWKRLLVAAWCRARGENVELLPALDGHGVDVVFRRTSELTKTEMAELIEFVQAWAVEQGIELADVWRDPLSGEVCRAQAGAGA
jgi:hypothetical protein